MSRARLAGALAALLAACGGSATRVDSAPAPGAPRDTSTAPLDASAADAGSLAPAAVLPSLEDLAGRGHGIAPGLREVARFELAASPAAVTHPLIAADAGDACVRVALAADTDVHAWLTDARSGESLADVASARDAALGPDGPVCVRRGTSVVLHVEAHAPGRARVVAWASGAR